MRSIMAVTALVLSLSALAADTLKTPYGILSAKRIEQNGAITMQIAVDGKPIGEILPDDNADFRTKPFNVKGQDVYVVHTFSNGNSRVALSEQSHALVVFAKGMKPKLFTSDEYYGNSEEITYAVKNDVLTANLGFRDKKSYLMTYDGTEMKVFAENPRAGAGRASLSKEDCHYLHDNFENFCETINEGIMSSAIESWFNQLDSDPGFNRKGLERVCKKKRPDYKTFHSKVCVAP